MHFALFYHSLVSDWNHGNAHFLRGVATTLIAQGHTVRIYEPAGGWSRRNLLLDVGEAAIADFHATYPSLHSTLYDPATLDLDLALEGTDVVIVHEWSDPALVRRIGQHRAATNSYKLLFHDTHHRAVSAPHELQAYDLSRFDGVLAFGEVLREMYELSGRVPRAWTWHEAADTRVFRPLEAQRAPRLDLVWVGNWGDGERERELQEFLVEPVRDLGLRARIHGVRYPAAALQMLRQAGIEYAGWIANHRAPIAFSGARCTVHVPRRFYREQLPGIPTIRMFEALACRIPLVSAPWDDCEGLFEPGADYLVAQDGAQMRQHLRDLISDSQHAAAVAEHGYQTILQRHTCAHRVRELLEICRELGAGPRPTVGAGARETQALEALRE